MSGTPDKIVPLIHELEKINLHFPAEHTYQQIQKDLADYINRLIDEDFNKLVLLLYRLDISEEKLRAALDADNGTMAGETIANMIIERQLQKIETRKQFNSPKDIPEDEKW